MNDKLKNFVTNIGLLCEVWTLVYRGFVSQGMDAKEALMHTEALTSTLIATLIQGNTNKE